jgi:Papain family cysteine protease
MKTTTLMVTAILGLSLNYAHADQDGAFLDPAYTNLIHPKVSLIRNKTDSKNDVADVISKLTPVRSQESRGTCSIFSATAYLEGLLIQKGVGTVDTLDLSEEWLQYTVNRGRTSDGSSGPRNFTSIKNNGMVLEATLPYIGQNWATTWSELKDSRCGKLTGDDQTSCFIVHRDPNLLLKTDEELTALKEDEFLSIRNEAKAFREQNIKFDNKASFYLYDTNTIKAHLKAGTPVVLEINFYYGAWNHRGGESIGLERNMDHWNKGIITSPEEGSLDAEASPKKPAGHSVLVVGYDDNRVVTKEIQMADGTRKTFTYKGVYYIKNSWGTSGFGKDFEVDGVTYPGYGMIVQKHADAEGSFYFLPLK